MLHHLFNIQTSERGLPKRSGDEKSTELNRVVLIRKISKERGEGATSKR